MTLGILELNDTGLRISDEQKIFAESAGVAVLQEKQALFGEPALRLHRLHPLNTFTHFWHRLSGDALSTSHPLFRHHADLAYSHLMQLHQAMPDCDEVIFALPGSFSREQMSLLLGIVGQCEFTAVGLVDAALAATANYLNSNHAIHIDIQLHQAIISVLEFNGKLQRTHVELIPHAGLVAIQDTLARGIAEHFLDQTRFDPLHSANTEQSLYDQLPQWLTTIKNEGETVLAVGTTNIKLSNMAIERILKPLFVNILNKASRQTNNNSQIIVSDRLHTLPGFCVEAASHTNNITELPREAAMQGIQQHLKQIRGANTQLNFIQSLQITDLAKQASDEKILSANGLPGITHCLIGSIAYPLLSVSKSEATFYIDADQPHVTNDATPMSLCTLHHNGSVVTIAPLKGTQITVNGKPVVDNCRLLITDSIELTNGLKLQLINVHNCGQ